MATYHEARLSEVAVHVGDAIDGFRNSDLDAFAVDCVLFQYCCAAKELWKFCRMVDFEFTARQLNERPPIDWWESGAPRRS